MDTMAKVLVTFDADGKIISIVDNGTEPGNVNQSFWNTALAMFDKLDGKTKDGVDAVDAVSGATYSSNAIKQAVRTPSPTRRGSSRPPRQPCKRRTIGQSLCLRQPRRQN